LAVGRAVGNRLGAHLAEGVTLPAVVPYALGLYLLARYAVVAAPIPWESILVPTSLSQHNVCVACRVSCVVCVRGVSCVCALTWTTHTSLWVRRERGLPTHSTTSCRRSCRRSTSCSPSTMKCRGSGTSTTPRFVLCVCVCVAFAYTARYSTRPRCAPSCLWWVSSSTVSPATPSPTSSVTLRTTHTHTRLHLTPMPNTSL
jgi:hypothetical protein